MSVSETNNNTQSTSSVTNSVNSESSSKAFKESANSNRFSKPRISTRGRRGLTNRGRGVRFNRDSRHSTIRNEEAPLQNAIITVKRVTRVVKGGKRMRFAAMVVVGDKAGRVGFGLKKGLDYQDAVNKAIKQAEKRLIKVSLNENRSVSFPVFLKFKSVKIFLKPAPVGTGLIAGGFLRPVLELAGIENVYSKLIGSRDKIAGVQAAFKALARYSGTIN
jgi:small subunit ribosomal protein S5